MRGLNFYHASHTEICIPRSLLHLEFGEGSREFFPYLFFQEQEKELSLHLCVCIFSSEGKSARGPFLLRHMAAAGRCSSSSWLPLQPVPELFWKFLVGCGHSSPACFLLWRAVLPSMSLCTLQRASHRSQQNDHRNDQYHSAYCQDFEEIMDLIIVGT